MAVDPLSLPFKEAITFLRGKVSMPSKSWKDFQKEQHDAAFVVAGAMKADLLADFRNAVDKAIAEGKSMQWFQEQFDTIVSRHGWKFYGDRTWRAETILGTNLRAAYAAGRHAQMTEPAFLKRNPYWEWRHGDSVRPRPQHLAWNGMVLRADDPFWTAHYPPCGWGCKCKAFALADDDVQAEGLKVLPAAPPPIAPASSGEVIPGVDKGWDYTPGATVAERLRPVMERKMDNLPPKISEALRKEIGGYLEGMKPRETPRGPAPAPPLQVDLSNSTKRKTREEMKEVLDSLPKGVMDAFISHDVQIVLAPSVVEYLPDLLDQHPMGYGTDATFREVAGIYESGKVVIGERAWYAAGREWKPVKIQTTLAHEIGHAFDLSGTKKAWSDSNEFQTAASLDLTSMQPGTRSTWGLPSGPVNHQELFARIFGSLLGYPDGYMLDARRDFPRTSALLDAAMMGKKK